MAVSYTHLDVYKRQLLKRIKLYKIHVFKYSPRKGTKAAVMENQVNGNVKEERSNKLLELSDKYEEEFNNASIGKTCLLYTS